MHFLPNRKRDDKYDKCIVRYLQRTKRLQHDGNYQKNDFKTFNASNERRGCLGLKYNYKNTHTNKRKTWVRFWVTSSCKGSFMVESNLILYNWGQESSLSRFTCSSEPQSKILLIVFYWFISAWVKILMMVFYLFFAGWGNYFTESDTYSLSFITLIAIQTPLQYWNDLRQHSLPQFTNKISQSTGGYLKRNIREDLRMSARVTAKLMTEKQSSLVFWCVGLCEIPRSLSKEKFSVSTENKNGHGNVRLMRRNPRFPYFAPRVFSFENCVSINFKIRISESVFCLS